VGSDVVARLVDLSIHVGQPGVDVERLQGGLGSRSAALVKYR
jgi:hypothetical protein